jgi:sugar phosphate isomerase/epimerase
MNPRLSFFGFTRDIDAIAAAGYDCIEMHMREFMPMQDVEFNAARQRLHASSLVCEVLDNPVPLDQWIADESFDLDFYQDYLKKGADRAAELGVRYYVFGNGRSRSLPAAGDIEAARQKNLRFMRMLADVAATRGITVLIEPLGPQVSNVIFSIPEALDYIKVVGKTNLGTFLDYRWFVDRGHPFKMIEEYGQEVRHVHLDNPISPFPRRLIPRLDDGHDYLGLFQALEKINYGGIISLEASTFVNFAQDLRDGMAFFAAFGIEGRPGEN